MRKYLVLYFFLFVVVIFFVLLIFVIFVLIVISCWKWILESDVMLFVCGIFFGVNDILVVLIWILLFISIVFDLKFIWKLLSFIGFFFEFLVFRLLCFFVVKYIVLMVLLELV